MFLRKNSFYVSGLRIGNIRKIRESDSMIYSEDIDKVCRVCVHSQEVKGSSGHIKCKRKGEYIPAGGYCDEFEYDIFKKNVRRKKMLTTRYSREDFTL